MESPTPDGSSPVNEQEQVPRFSTQRKEHHYKIYKTPKEVAVALLTLAENKAAYNPVRLLSLAILAGLLVGVGTHAGLMCMSLIQPPQNPEYNIINIVQAQRLTYGSVLAIGLLALLMMGAELYTGNSMTITLGMCARAVPVHRGLYNLGGVFIGNVAGCVAWAYFISVGSDLFELDPFRLTLENVTVAKTTLSFSAAFTRAIGANALVCIAVFLCVAAEDIPGKVMACYTCLFTMAASGYEHIILNQYLLHLGVMMGSERSYGDVVLKNFIPVFLGNSAIGALMGVSLYFWYLHGRVVEDRKPAPQLPPEVGKPIPQPMTVPQRAYRWVVSKCKRSGDDV